MTVTTNLDLNLGRLVQGFDEQAVDTRQWRGLNLRVI
jgi:hypothetical protein